MSDEIVVTAGGEEEDLKKYGGPQGCVLRWLKELSLVKDSKAQKKFEKTGEHIIRVYRNSGEDDGTFRDESSMGRVMFNVLWSNVQVLKPSLYSHMPKVVAERTFKDSDPVGRLAALGAERATHYMLLSQQDRFNYGVRSAVEDRLLPGRGQMWLRYTADFEVKTPPELGLEGDDEAEIDADELSGAPEESSEALEVPKPNTEKVLADYVFWQDYFEATARTPYEVRWRARRTYMTRAQCVKRFGEKIGNAIELNHNPTSKRKKYEGEDREFFQQAEIFEIWNEDDKCVYWISEGYMDGPLDYVKDPLKLKDFWPCPIPLLATITTDSTYPTPDYKIYERLAKELDSVTKRIQAMCDCVRFVGMHAASLSDEIKKMQNLNDGQSWPVANWAAFMEKGGLESAINWFPFEKAVEAIQPLMTYQQSLITQIRSISRIPDVLMGESDPTDPVYTQQLKGKALVLNMRDPQQDVQRFCREIISKMAEIIFEPGLFSDDTIALMAGVAQMSPEDQAMWPQALQLLRDDRLRTFRIDIETDSTIAVDEDEDKRARQEYFTAMTQLASTVQNIQQFRPELIHPMIESAKFVANSFRTGRSIQGSWDKALQQIEDNDKRAAEMAAQQPPPPDYEMLKIQNEQAKIQATMAELPLKQQEMQLDMQIKQQEAALEQQDMQFKQSIEVEKLQLEGQKAQMDFDIKAQEVQIKAQEVLSKESYEQTKAELDAFKAQFSGAIEQQRLQLDAYMAQGELREKLLEEARLKHDTQIEQVKLQIEAAKLNQEKSNAEKGDSKPAIPAIHIHNTGSSKDVTIKRNPDGSLSGRSRRVKDDDE